MCVFFVGEMVGSALSAFQVFHKREPSQEEHMEIVIELVEQYAEEIQDFLHSLTKFSHKLSKTNVRKD